MIDYETMAVLQKLENQSIDNHNSNVKHINTLYSHQSKELLNQQMNILKDITAHVFSKATAYSNVIIIAGYVAFFAIWNHVKDQLPEKLTLIAALLISLSIIVFVLFEVYKMILNSLYFRKASMAFKEKKDPAEIILTIQKQSESLELKMARIWLYALIPSIAFGISAAAILVAYFVIKLTS